MLRSFIPLCVVFLALAPNIPSGSAQSPGNYNVSNEFKTYSNMYETEMTEKVVQLAKKADSILRSTVQKVWESSYVQHALKVPLVRSSFECVSKQMKPTNAHMTEMVNAIVAIVSHFRALNIEIGSCFRRAKAEGKTFKVATCIKYVTGGAAQTGIESQQQFVLNFVRVYAAFDSFVNTVNNCVFGKFS